MMCTSVIVFKYECKCRVRLPRQVYVKGEAGQKYILHEYVQGNALSLCFLLKLVQDCLYVQCSNLTATSTMGLTLFCYYLENILYLDAI